MRSAGRKLNSLWVAGICCALLACSDDESEKVEPEPPQLSVEITNAAAMVGGKPLSVAELRNYLVARSLGHGEVSVEVLTPLLEEMVIGEVLYQEALRRELDQTPDMRRAFRQMLGQKLLEEEVRNRVLARDISDEEIKAYFAQHLAEYAWPEQVRLANIFIGVEEGTSDEGQANRAKLAEQVLAHAVERQADRFGFSELIYAHSDKHPNFAFGDTGFFDRDGRPVGLAKVLAEAGFSLDKNGQLYPQVIETPEGFHVVMRVGHRAARSRDYRDVESEIVQRIRRDALEQQRGAYIRGLREQADIRIETSNLEKLASEMREKKIEEAERGAGSDTSTMPSSPSGDP